MTKALPPLDGFTVDPDAGHVINPRGHRVGHPNSNGYVLVSLYRERRKFRAHRVIWEAVHGPIPEGLEINHVNGVKTDNRIENLELVTRGENLSHAFRLGLKNYRGERHPQSRLTAANVAEIRERASTESQASLAIEFGVSAPHINRIVHHRTWTGEKAA